MAEFFMEFWYWWMFSVAFLGIEILVAGFFFLWLAVSAFIVGSVLLLIPGTSMEIQLFLFSLLSVTSVMGWRKYAGSRSTETDHPLLNQRGSQYLGRVFDLIEPIENGRGKVRVDDSIWKVRGPDCDVECKVRVVAVEGTVFEVEVVESK